VDITTSIDGFESLNKALDMLREEFGKGKTDAIYRKAMKAAMQPVLDAAKTYAPKDTDQLEQHIYMKVHRPMARDKAGKYYAGEVYMARVSASPVREDSEIKVILTKKGKFQNYWSGLKPVAVSQEFGNARTPAHPFLRPALDNNMDRVQNLLGVNLWSEIEKLAAKGK
jgi:HK97 gp10 family phage protein